MFGGAIVIVAVGGIYKSICQNDRPGAIPAKMTVLFFQEYS